MRVAARSVAVAFTVDGYHRWPAAPEHRAYLADRHRHRFAFTVTIPVDHNERAVEFHDLLDYCTALYCRGVETDFGDASCETIAEELAHAVAGWAHYPPWVQVSVSEDGYVTGTVRLEED